jgi:tetratricopeptide (TPR) repeat protein
MSVLSTDPITVDNDPHSLPPTDLPPPLPTEIVDSDPHSQPPTDMPPPLPTDVVDSDPHSQPPTDMPPPLPTDVVDSDPHSLPPTDLPPPLPTDVVDSDPHSQPPTDMPPPLPTDVVDSDPHSQPPTDLPPALPTDTVPRGTGGQTLAPTGGGKKDGTDAEKPEDKIFTTAQQDWLADALALDAKLDGIENDMEKQDQVLDEVDGYLEDHLRELKVGDVFSAEVIEPGMLGAIKDALGLNATMWTVSKDGKAKNEIDLDNEIIKRLDKDPAKAEEKAKKLFAAQNMIMAQVEKMRAQKKEDGTPLFTDRDIADEVFAPLMRQKVLPESFIPDRYSEVSRVFKGASDEYQERLTAYSESLNDNDGVLQKLGMGQDFVSTLGTVASSAITMAGVLGGGSVANTLTVDDVSNIVKLSTSVLSGSMDMAQQILKSGGVTKDNFIALVKDVVGIAASTVMVAFTQEWGSSDKAHQGMAKAIGSGLQIGLASASFGIDLYNKQYDKAFGDLGDIAGGCCSVYYYNTVVQGTSSSSNWNDVNTGTAITGAIKTAAQGVGLVAIIDKQRKAVEEGGKWDPTEIEAALVKMFEAAASGMVSTMSGWQLNVTDTNKENEKGSSGDTYKDAFKAYTAAQEKTPPDVDTMNKYQEDYEQYCFIKFAEEPVLSQFQTAGSSGPQYSAADQALSLLQTKTPKELEKLYAKDPSLKALAGLVKKQQATVVEESRKSDTQRLTEEAKAFRDALNASEDDDGAEVDKIETLIMEIKKSYMMVQLAQQLASLPVQAVCAFVPQANIAAGLVDLAFAMKRAATHLQAYAEWAENVDDARAAMSVQVEAMLNRAGLSELQYERDIADIALAVAKIEAGVLSCCGHAAPAGYALNAAVAATTSLKQLAIKYYDKGKLEFAWKTYKEALKNPKNRKKVREAIRENPTLAKYVIAYGAEWDDNPVARNALKKCGLTERVLDSKDTNVQKVVTFLEALYPDDPILLKEVATKEDWYPGSIELTAESVAMFFVAAEKSADLAPGQGRDLIVAISDFGDQMAKLEDARAVWVAAQEERGNAESAVKDDDESSKAALNKAVEQESKALWALQDALDLMTHFSGTVVRILATLKPLDKKDKPHKQMLTYLGELLPLANGVDGKYQREEDKMANLKGAMVKDGNGMLQAPTGDEGGDDEDALLTDDDEDTAQKITAILGDIDNQRKLQETHV